MESAAMPMLINTTLEKCINTKDFNRAFHWIASHILLVRTDLQGSGFEDIKLKKIHINDAIKVVEDLVSGYTKRMICCLNSCTLIALAFFVRSAVTAPRPGKLPF
jgi:hypothetical protein